MNREFKPGDKVMGWRDVSFFSQDDIIEPFHGTIEQLCGERYEIKTRDRIIKVYSYNLSFFIKELYYEAVKKCIEAKKLENESRKLNNEIIKMMGT